MHIGICQLSICGGRNHHFHFDCSEDLPPPPSSSAAAAAAGNGDKNNRQLNVGSESSHGQHVVKVLTF